MYRCSNFNCYGKVIEHALSHVTEVNSRCTYMHIYDSEPKNSNTAKLRKNPVQVYSIPAGVPQHIFPPQREPNNISFHLCGISADSAGFPWPPSPCRSLVRCPSCHPTDSVRILKETQCTDPDQWPAPSSLHLPFDSWRIGHCCLYAGSLVLVQKTTETRRGE